MESVRSQIQVFYSKFSRIMMPLGYKMQFFLGCYSLSALTYSNWANVQKFITFRPFMRRNFSTSVLFNSMSDSDHNGTKTGIRVNCAVRI
jgi:hypothetical protein